MKDLIRQGTAITLGHWIDAGKQAGAAPPWKERRDGAAGRMAHEASWNAFREAFVEARGSSTAQDIEECRVEFAILWDQVMQGLEGSEIVSPWRPEPPTIKEVRTYSWWWNKPTSGNPPHILQLDVGQLADEQYDEATTTIVKGPALDVVLLVGDGRYNDGTGPFDPNDWPGEWAPAVSPL